MHMLYSPNQPAPAGKEDIMMNYPYTPGIPLSREHLDVMRLRFAPEWPLAEIARLIQSVGGRIVNDGRGGLVVVKGGAIDERV